MGDVFSEEAACWDEGFKSGLEMARDILLNDGKVKEFYNVQVKIEEKIASC